MNFSVTGISLRNFQRLALAGLLCLLVTGTATAASALQQHMQTLKREYTAAMASQSVTAFASHVERLQSTVDQLSRLDYHQNRATWQQGMQELQKELAQTRATLKLQNLDAAKQVLSQVNVSKKHYHALLN